MVRAAKTYGRRPPGLLARIAHLPPIRIVLYAAVVGGAFWLQGIAAGGLARVLGSWWPSRAVGVILAILAVHFAYRGMTWLLEERPADELARTGAARETGAGIVVGAVCLSLTVAIIAGLGYYQVESIGAWTALLTAFGMAATSGYIEEVVFRGILFRIVEEWLGTWFAFAISVGFFGFAHLNNPNATLYGAAAIGIEAGLLLGAAYILTRRLWLAIGIHFGWNFMQAGVFGPNLSGHEVGSLLQSRLSGPDLLSGGALGVEGSLFAVLVCGALSAWFLLQARRRGAVVPPFWRRSRD